MQPRLAFAPRRLEEHFVGIRLPGLCRVVCDDGRGGRERLAAGAESSPFRGPCQTCDLSMHERRAFTC